MFKEGSGGLEVAVESRLAGSGPIPRIRVLQWGSNKWGLKGCPPSLDVGLFRPFLLFRPFPKVPDNTWKIQKTEEKGPFPQKSSDLLKPPSLKPPLAALQEKLNLVNLRGPDWRELVSSVLWSEEDKRATTNVQNGLVFFFLFSFILFYSLWTQTVVKPLNSKRKSWRKNSEKLWESVKMCGKVPKSVKRCRDDFAL